MNEIEKAKKLVSLTFQLEQELMRGTWDEDKETNKLIEFAENFNDNVKKNLKFVSSEDGE